MTERTSLQPPAVGSLWLTPSGRAARVVGTHSRQGTTVTLHYLNAKGALLPENLLGEHQAELAVTFLNHHCRRIS